MSNINESKKQDKNGNNNEDILLNEITSSLSMISLPKSSTPPSTPNNNNNNNKNKTFNNSGSAIKNNFNNNGSIIGERAVQYFGYLVLSQGHIWRATTSNDIGIDGQIEFVNNFSRKGSKAIICGVQLKATIVDKNASINIESVNYWIKYPLPVIVVQVYFKQSINSLPTCLFLTKEQVQSYINSTTLNTPNKNSSSTSSTTFSYSSPTQSPSPSPSSSSNSLMTMVIESRVFDKNRAKDFSCDAVQEYCIEYMRNNYVNYTDNRYQDYLKIQEYSKMKADQIWKDLVHKFLKLKPTYNLKEVIVFNLNNNNINNNNNNDENNNNSFNDDDYENDDNETFLTNVQNLFEFPFSIIQDNHRDYLKEQLIEFGYDHNVSLRNICDQIYHLHNNNNDNNNEFINLSKWFSYLYCILNIDPIKSIENDILEINLNSSIKKDIIYIEILILEICDFILPNYYKEIITNQTTPRLIIIKNIIHLSKTSGRGGGSDDGSDGSVNELLNNSINLLKKTNK
ncbi:hypothetical protein ACTFIW_007993 [Dictyostelium discoideum]